MAQEFKIGRLRFTWSGAWTPGTQYARDSVVSYGGKTYVCLTPNTASAAFYTDLYRVNNAGQPAPYWNLIVDGKSFSGQWTTGASYGLGNIVITGGQVYYCTLGHTAGVFATDLASGNWAVYTQAVNWRTNWQPNTFYQVNDIVSYGGIVYECTGNHTSAATTALGLEVNQSNWKVFYLGISYKGTWSATTRYSLNDIVKVDGALYICTTYHTSTTSFDNTKFGVYIPDELFSLAWDLSKTYQVGDIVSYGGYDYVNNTANNTNNIPATDAIDWTIIVKGYEIQTTWDGAFSYKVGDVVRSASNLFVALSNNTNQAPLGSIIPTTYTLAGSSGTTLVVGSTAGVAVGSIVTGVGLYSGQTVTQVVDAATVILNVAPDMQLTNGQAVTFTGINSTYWSILSSSVAYQSRWVSTSRVYTPGEIVYYGNTTYQCVTLHTSSSALSPILDTNNTYWISVVYHFRKNAMTNTGDLYTVNSTATQYSNIPLGNLGLALRTTGNLPTWSKINQAPNVFYVSTTTGIDRADYGVSWDQPWKTIQYATQQVAAGTASVRASALLQANKTWILTEMINWTLYQIQQGINPYSGYSLDSTKAARDAGYIIDALSYDIARGGNSQTIATALAYFAFGSTNTFFNAAVTADMPYFYPMLTQLGTLMQLALTKTAPSQSYQTLMNVSAVNVVYQNTTALSAEVGSAATVSSLYNYITTALTNSSTLGLPTQNQGVSATIFVKTGTYSERLPIIVPANVAIVGDELRGVVVQPYSNIQLTATSVNVVNNSLFVNNTVGLSDGMTVQFVAPNIAVVTGNGTYSGTFGGITLGQNYYVVGSSITANSFAVTSSPTISFQGTVTQGSPVISDVPNIIGLAPGATVTGQGIPSNVTILSVTTAPSNSLFARVTLSAVATGSFQNVALTAAGIPVTLTQGSGNMTVYAGDCLSDMFRMRNGTGLRNMSLVGLQGTLLSPDAYFIQHPSGGSYVAFDPGNGPNDSNAWIIRRSPYAQNVTTFGNGAVGMKIDGTLHNGGTKSMVCNDFTQIINDGVGIWCTGPGAITECISVFCYYGYTGYFAEAGGKIRAANGNSSYGVYGVISSGYDLTETPATGAVFNRSSQVQASVQSSLGNSAQIIKLNYNNAGSSYNVPTTNLLSNSNNFTGQGWASDVALQFEKIAVAPTGVTEAYITANTSDPNTSYFYQNLTVNPAGAVYTNTSTVTVTGVGAGISFNITVTATAYLATVNLSGANYALGDTVKILGTQLGGATPANDCILTISSIGLGGSGVQAIPAGTVPTGSAQNYTFSIYIYQGSGTQVDIQAIWSGSSTVTSGVNYNFTTGAVTPYSFNGGVTPVTSGALVQLSPGWYRLWFAAYDTTGLNSSLQFRVYPKGITGLAGLYNYVYGAQVEISNPILVLTNNPTTPLNAPSFYLETIATSRYTAYANLNITGSGTGIQTIADEIRSNAVFQGVITTNGSGFKTASNTAQLGDSTSVQLAQSDTATQVNYSGMRVFINSGTGAGQYGYISLYNSTTKTASILRENFSLIPVTSTASLTGLFTTNATLNGTNLYSGQLIQFIPTYYSTNVTSTSLAQTTITATAGGTVNTMTASSTSGLRLNMSVTFSGTVFGGVSTGYTFFIYAILDGTTFQISNTQYGNIWPLTNATGSMTMSYTSNSGYLAGTTTTMVPNYPIVFTGTPLGGITIGNTYYIQDIVDANNFTIATGLVSVTVTAGAASVGQNLNVITCNSTTNLIVLNPISFVGSTPLGLTDNTKYYVNSIIDSTTFTVASSITTVNILGTTGLINGNYTVVCNSTGGFIPKTPIIFVGTTTGNIIAETVYFVKDVINGTQFTISQTPTGGQVQLTTSTGSYIAKTTAGAIAGVTTVSGVTGCTATSTNKKTSLTQSQGTMVGSYNTQLFGGVTFGQNYYVTTLNQGPSGTFQVSTTLNGQAITLTDNFGAMNVAAVGWDHVTPCTPIQSQLDLTSAYFIEPRTIFTPPSFTQTVAANTSNITLGTGTYTVMAYGGNKFIALPSTGIIGAISLDGSTWSALSLPTSGSWTGLAYGNNYWVGVASGSSLAYYSNSNGTGWRASNLTTSTTWNSVAYGNGVFVASASGSIIGNYSTDFGKTWLTVQSTITTPQVSGFTVSGGTATVTFGSALLAAFIPGSTVTLSGFNPFTTSGSVSVNGTAFTVLTSSTTQLTFALAGTYATNILGTVTGTINGMPVSQAWSQIVWGQGTFVAISNDASAKIAYSTNGSMWYLASIPAGTFSSITWGNGRFLAVPSSTNTAPIYSFDGKTWYSSPVKFVANQIIYGQGTFIALATSGTVAYQTNGGIDWTQQTVTNDGYSSCAFGYSSTNIGTFATLSSTGVGSTILAGTTAQGRPQIVSNAVSSITLWEPGSNYTTPPTVNFIDPNATTSPTVLVRTGLGTLGNPSFVNKGTGYNSTSTVTIVTGNGYADQAQSGLTLIVNNLTTLPSPGSNLTITGVSGVFKITSATAAWGTSAPNIEANIALSPALTVAQSPANGTQIQIRLKYSQARLTNHDFLNIGYGDQVESNYPGYPTSGYVAIANNQTIEVNYGRVFFTSTDQDGNFKVGNLFGVQQATGIVTLSTSQFGLSGLSSLALGGIAIGGSSTTIYGFSTDGSFTASSDNVIPTQRAIKSYLTSRFSQGGANTFTGQLTAGTVVVGSPNYIRSSVPNGFQGSVIKMVSKVYINATGTSGNLNALASFISAQKTRAVVLQGTGNTSYWPSNPV